MEKNSFGVTICHAWLEIIAWNPLRKCFGAYFEPNYFMMHNISEIINVS